MAKSSTSFKKGNNANPKGRPPRKTEQEYLNRFLKAVPMAAWERIIKKAVEHAELGDKDARNFLAQYAMGKPEQKVSADVDADIEVILRVINDR